MQGPRATAYKRLMEVYTFEKFASLQVCKYTSIQVSKCASVQVCKCASVQVCQVCKCTSTSTSVRVAQIAPHVGKTVAPVPPPPTSTPPSSPRGSPGAHVMSLSSDPGLTPHTRALTPLGPSCPGRSPPPMPHPGAPAAVTRCYKDVTKLKVKLPDQSCV